MVQNYTLNELSLIAKKIIATANSKILLFYGEMGVGKTTLIKEIVSQLGSSDIASSPTFSLVNEYHSNLSDSIFHFDFYRIEAEEEALDIGIEEYFHNNNWCLIEWPNKVENLLPLNSTIITISSNENQLRTIELKNNG